MRGLQFQDVQPPSRPEPPTRRQMMLQRARDWVSRRRYILLMLANVLVTLLVLAIFSALQPVAPVITQGDIDAAVNRTLASATPRPAVGAVVYSIIQPSLVLVHSTYDGKDKDGVGSGVIFDQDGNILSALHVVKGAKQIEVVFADGLKSEAEIMAASEENDIVVLHPKTVPDDIVPAVLAGTPNIGDDVYAVGNPFGIQDSFSAGVVSGLRRKMTTTESGSSIQDLIQFDAAVNPGNSGGPLLNRDGEVVGIVVSLLNPTEQRVFIGIGFAVPIATASGVAGDVPY